MQNYNYRMLWKNAIVVDLLYRKTNKRKQRNQRRDNEVSDEKGGLYYQTEYRSRAASFNQ